MRRFESIAWSLVIALLGGASAASGNVYTVTTTANTGNGSLRWAIGQANSHAGADQVTFGIPGSGVRVIQPLTPLPSLAAGTSILGHTQPGYAGSPLIRVDGGNLAGNVWGFDTAGDNVTIQGLQIVRFLGPGVRVWHTGVAVRASWIGHNGTAALGNQGSGIACHSGSGLVVGGIGVNEGNVIAGNGGAGVSLDESCAGAVLWGNRIGTNAAGTAALGNQGGVRIDGDNNLIGGATAGMPNVISGNAYSGITIGGTSSGNDIFGNRIGTTANGSAALGNQGSGISVAGDGNEIGGAGAGDGNTISGNGADGVVIDLGGESNFVRGNRVGLDATGSSMLPNGGNGLRIWSSLNTIGGIAGGASNTISGNTYAGLFLGAQATGNTIRGNRIGTNAAGTTARGNGGIGVWLLGDFNTVGGSAAGEGNLISGNVSDGIAIGTDATGNTLQGNRIGTNPAGDADLGNGGGGIVLTGPENVVGGDAAGAGNLISGNAYDGIGLYGENARLNQIVRNRIGTNLGGSAAIPNEGYALRAIEGSENVVRGNLMSGNGRAFSLEAATSLFVVQGNIIGLNAAMTAKLPNQSTGLDIAGHGHQIGGTAAGQGNVIAGNQYSGIWITDGAEGNVLEGNFIGTNPAGDGGLGNAQTGIILTEAGPNTIGGVEPGAGNRIAYNGYLGIYVWSGAGVSILGNSIHDNVLMGIDLHPQGPVANDAGDWDAGPNRGQNYPVVTAALAAGGTLEIEGFLKSRPATEYRIEIFSNPTFDATGMGEGRNFLGAVDVTTDLSGLAEFATTLPAAGADAFVTATATAPSLDSSEFSPAIAVGAPQAGQLQIWRDLLLSYEGVPGVEVSIVRSHGVAGSVSVDVDTVDGTADSPADFGPIDRTITFAPGEVVRTIFVPIVADAEPESDETWRLQLTNPSPGALLGANHDVLAWLFDASPAWPMYSIGNATIVEGDDGAKSLQFTVTLTPSDHEVAIEWWTTDGSAVVGEDYLESTGELHFQPGQTSKTITVQVLGDEQIEDDESFYVHLYALDPAVVWSGLGDGRILDNDGGSTNYIFADAFETGASGAWSSIVGQP